MITGWDTKGQKVVFKGKMMQMLQSNENWIRLEEYHYSHVFTNRIKSFKSRLKVVFLVHVVLDD